MRLTGPIFLYHYQRESYITAGDCQRVGLALLWSGERGNCPRGQPVGADGREISAENSRADGFSGAVEDQWEPPESKPELEGLS